MRERRCGICVIVGGSPAICGSAGIASCGCTTQRSACGGVGAESGIAGCGSIVVRTSTVVGMLCAGVTPPMAITVV